MKKTKTVLSVLTGLAVLSSVNFMSCDSGGGGGGGGAPLAPQSPTQTPPAQTPPALGGSDAGGLDDDDSSSGDSTPDADVSLDSKVIGDKVTIGGADYYVVRNTTSGASSDFRSASFDVTPDTGDADINAALARFASLQYVNKFLEEVGITEYVQLWSAAAEVGPATDEAKGVSSFSTDYLIANKDGKKIAIYRETYSSNFLIKSLQETDAAFNGIADTVAARAAAFNAIPKQDFRTKYYPSEFKVITYPSDIAEKVILAKGYNYNSDSSITLDNSKIDHINDSYNFAKIDGTTRDAFVLSEYPNGKNGYNNVKGYSLKGAKGKFYTIEYSKGSTSNKAALQCVGDGSEANLNTDTGLVKVSLETTAENFVFSVKRTGSVYEDLDLRAEVPFRNIEAAGGILGAMASVRVNNGAWDESRALPQSLEEYKDYIRFSKDLVEMNGYKVPKDIWIRAAYNKDTVHDREYLDVKLVPDTSKTSGVVYKIMTTPLGKTLAGGVTHVPVSVKTYSDNFEAIAAGTYTEKSRIFVDDRTVLYDKERVVKTDYGSFVYKDYPDGNGVYDKVKQYALKGIVSGKQKEFYSVTSCKNLSDDSTMVTVTNRGDGTFENINKDAGEVKVELITDAQRFTFKISLSGNSYTATKIRADVPFANITAAGGFLGATAKVKVNDGSEDSSKAAQQALEPYKDYIRFSENIVTKNGLQVPEDIWIRAPFKAGSVMNRAYLEIKLVPLDSEAGVIYGVMNTNVSTSAGDVNAPMFVRQFVENLTDIKAGTYTKEYEIFDPNKGGVYNRSN